MPGTQEPPGEAQALCVYDISWIAEPGTKFCKERQIAELTEGLRCPRAFPTLPKKVELVELKERS
jgi:hypothetical protein